METVQKLPPQVLIEVNTVASDFMQAEGSFFTDTKSLVQKLAEIFIEALTNKNIIVGENLTLDTLSPEDNKLVQQLVANMLASLAGRNEYYDLLQEEATAPDAGNSI